MEILKEHRLFRNQLILVTIIFFVGSWFISEFLAFGVIFGLITLWNIFSYKQNVKDYNLLKGKK
jgi:hypothetical protein